MASLNQMLGTLGGGIVRRTFRNGDVQQKAGDYLSADQLLTIARIAPANFQALVDKKYIETYPRAPGGGEGVERHVVSAAFGKFDVIAGRRLNAAPLLKDEAYALAGIETSQEIQAPAPPAKRKYTRKADKQ